MPLLPSKGSPRYYYVAHLLVAMMMLAAVTAACVGEDSTPASVPTQAPNPAGSVASPVTTLPPSDPGDVGEGSGECTIGLVLNPGDKCSYDDFTMMIREDGAAVLDGNIGGITMGNTVMNGQSISLNRFSAVRSGSTWTIESLP